MPAGSAQRNEMHSLLKRSPILLFTGKKNVVKQSSMLDVSPVLIDRQSRFSRIRWTRF
jgi:hypothetical protein